jgi:hypothetical protein
MIVLFVLLGIGFVLAAGAAYDWHIKRHHPHDLSKINPEGLPSEASIRSGELGRGAASEVYRNLGGGSGGTWG